jgi:hypothetical protein
LCEFYKLGDIGIGDLYCSPSVIFTPVLSVLIYVLKASKLFDSWADKLTQLPILCRNVDSQIYQNMIYYS